MSPEIELPANYMELLEVLNARIAGTRVQAQRTVNTLVIELYWSLGRGILGRKRPRGGEAESLGGWPRTWL